MLHIPCFYSRSGSAQVILPFDRLAACYVYVYVYLHVDVYTHFTHTV